MTSEPVPVKTGIINQMQKNIKLKNAILVTDKGLNQSDITLIDGRIDLSAKQIQCDETLDLSGKYILPGFVDTHFHGCNLFEFTLGQFNPKTETFDNSNAAYQAGIDMLTKKLPQFGVTGFYLGTWASPLDNQSKCFTQLAKFLNSETSRSGARIFGGLLEGTFINPNCSGAQNPEFIFEPSTNVFDHIENNDVLKLVSVAPEFGKKSCQLIEYLTAKGITVGAGHTNSTVNQFQDAIKAGLKYCVHFLNAIGQSYKPFNGGGAVEAVLTSDRLYAEIISDGLHVSPAYVRDTIKRKGIEKIIAATDSIYVAGSDLSEFDLCGIKGAVADDHSYFYVAGQPNKLFSSNLTMNRAFENYLNWLTTDIPGIWNRRHPAMDFDDALIAASKICSTNALTLTGLDSQGFGLISDCAYADLCVVEITGSPGRFTVQVDTTIVNGSVVYQRK